VKNSNSYGSVIGKKLMITFFVLLMCSFQLAADCGGGEEEGGEEEEEMVSVSGIVKRNDGGTDWFWWVAGVRIEGLANADIGNKGYYKIQYQKKLHDNGGVVSLEARGCSKKNPNHCCHSDKYLIRKNSGEIKNKTILCDVGH
jgi:hypothetical protein